ncbi:hypothetical protein Pint_27161 [Pistacia integerrima]|uniref:Uncharacterized protein n=1 Tax=Pistacia integerrima TaxID=434235 RepID=A0ACC0YVB6_9ROSI|nr:hypothetical protein Pint_27161 [Pistacia integerrima]
MVSILFFLLLSRNFLATTQQGQFNIRTPQKTVVWTANRDNPPVQGNVTLLLTDKRGENVSLNLDVDGHLYLVNSTGFVIKDLTPGGYSIEGTIYLMKIDTDGIFRLYSFKLNQNSSVSIVWASSVDKCSSKGLCGLNRYCVKNDRDIYCKCLPGFLVSGEGGCQKNFSTENCESKDGNIKYTIDRVANTTWEDASYSILSLPTEEECEKACLEDCSCEAAMFKDGECRKQKLPLRFGIKLESESNLALIKVGVSNFAGAPGEGDEPKRSKKERPDGFVNCQCFTPCFFIHYFDNFWSPCLQKSSSRL